jgi:hypothetical protein
MPTQKNLHNDNPRYKSSTKVHSDAQQTIRAPLFCNEMLKQAMSISLLGLRLGEQRLLK